MFDNYFTTTIFFRMFFFSVWLWIKLFFCLVTLGVHLSSGDSPQSWIFLWDHFQDHLILQPIDLLELNTKFIAIKTSFFFGSRMRQNHKLWPFLWICFGYLNRFISVFFLCVDLPLIRVTSSNVVCEIETMTKWKKNYNLQTSDDLAPLLFNRWLNRFELAAFACYTFHLNFFFLSLCVPHLNMILTSRK